MTRWGAWWSRRGARRTPEIVYGPGGGKLALMNGQTLSKAFVPLPAGATAVYTASGLAYYRHADWLGSARLASTPSRGVYYDGAYAPYGESYAESGTTDRSFTGQNQDTVAGLYDFMFRQYHAVQGRWISPDPAGLGAVNPASPQSWNRYAYVSNNPLRLTDPLGLFTCGNCPAPPPDISPDDITIFSGAVGWGPDYFSLIFKHGPGRGSWSDLLPLPTADKGYCSFTANVGNLDQAAKDAIQQIFNQAGVGIDFVNGPASVTGNAASVWLGWKPGVIGHNYGDPFGRGEDTFVFSPGAVAVLGVSVGATQEQIDIANGVNIGHEIGHYMAGCQHGRGIDCGASGLMKPASPPDIRLWNPNSSDYQFTPQQNLDVQRNCLSLQQNGHL